MPPGFASCHWSTKLGLGEKERNQSVHGVLLIMLFCIRKCWIRGVLVRLLEFLLVGDRGEL